MNCSVCGAQIPMGQPKCLNCGTMIPMGGYQQPMRQPVQQSQPMRQPIQQPQPMRQPMQQPQPVRQPMQQVQPVGQSMQQPPQKEKINVNNMMGMVDEGVMKLVELVGALLIMLSPFLSWCTCKFDDEKETFNMFALAKGDYGIKVFAVLAVIMILIGAVLILWGVCEKLFPSLVQIKSKLETIPFFELILVGIVLVLFIIAMSNDDVNTIIDFADTIDKGSHGVGPFFCVLGMLASAAPRVLKILGIKIG